jgi:hypothetical protein
VQCNNNALLCFAKDILDSVAKLKLDWCVALQLTGPNFGGWVSENYLDLARLIRWFYSSYHTERMTHHMRNQNALTLHGMLQSEKVGCV